MIEILGLSYCDCRSLSYSMIKSVVEFKSGRAHIFVGFPSQRFPAKYMCICVCVCTIIYFYIVLP